MLRRRVRGGRATGDYLSTAEAAALLGVSASRVRQLSLAGELPHAMRVAGKFFRRADIERFKRARAQAKPRRR